MKQKAEHHLSFLPERIETASQAFLPILPQSVRVNGGSSNATRNLTIKSSNAPSRPSSAAPDKTRSGAGAENAEVDAAGEADDATQSAEGSRTFRGEAGAGPQSNTATQRHEGEENQAGRSIFFINNVST